jgi:hypothetical protein
MMGKKEILLLLIAIIFSISVLAATQENENTTQSQIMAGNATGAPGDDVQVPIFIDSQDIIKGFDFTIKAEDERIDVVNAEFVSPYTSSILGQSTDNGTLHLVGVLMQDITQSSGLTHFLDVTYHINSGPAGIVTLPLANITLSDDQGQLIGLEPSGTGTDGKITITALEQPAEQPVPPKASGGGGGGGGGGSSMNSCDHVLKYQDKQYSVVCNRVPPQYAGCCEDQFMEKVCTNFCVVTEVPEQAMPFAFNFPVSTVPQEPEPVKEEVEEKAEVPPMPEPEQGQVIKVPKVTKEVKKGELILLYVAGIGLAAALIVVFAVYELRHKRLHKEHIRRRRK